MSESPLPESPARTSGTAGSTGTPVPEDPALIRTLRSRGPGCVVFERFKLVRELGAGGMAVVWLAHDERLDLQVALKFLPGMVATDPEALHDLRREITRGLRLTHPGIVRLYDLHEQSSEGLAAIAMEYIDGSTLADEKGKQPKRCFDVGEPLGTWTRSLCDALSYIHEEARVVHRDLKPRNLMLTATGRLKVADFGIAATLCDSHSRITQIPGSSGTPLYMSPQQALGRQPSATDDIYAMGATLYELITSKPPFFRGGMAVILNQVSSEIAPSMTQRRGELGIDGMGEIPPVWEEVVAACLAKSPTDRPDSAAEVLERLGLRETARGHGEGAAGTATPRSPAQPPALSSEGVTMPEIPVLEIPGQNTLRPPPQTAPRTSPPPPPPPPVAPPPPVQTHPSVPQVPQTANRTWPNPPAYPATPPPSTPAPPPLPQTQTYPAQPPPVYPNQGNTWSGTAPAYPESGTPGYAPGWPPPRGKRRVELNGWMLVVLPTFFALWIWWFVQPGFGMGAVWLTGVGFCTLFIGLEAKLLGAGQYGDYGPDGRPRRGVLGWVLLCGLLWPVFYPIYLSARRTYGARNLLIPGILVAVLYCTAPLLGSLRSSYIPGQSADVTPPPPPADDDWVSATPTPTPTPVPVTPPRTVSNDNGSNRNAPAASSDLPDADDPKVTDQLLKILQNSPGVRQTGVTPSTIEVSDPVEISYDEQNQVRHCRARFESNLGRQNITFLVKWRDRSRRTFEVRVVVDE